MPIVVKKADGSVRSGFKAAAVQVTKPAEVPAIMPPLMTPGVGPVPTAPTPLNTVNFDRLHPGSSDYAMLTRKSDSNYAYVVLEVIDPLTFKLRVRSLKTGNELDTTFGPREQVLYDLSRVSADSAQSMVDFSLQEAEDVKPNGDGNADTKPPRRVKGDDIPYPKHEMTGKPLCRTCKGDLPKGKRSFCSPQCVDAHLILTTPSHARKRVGERDSGVCACCNFDTKTIVAEYHSIRDKYNESVTRVRQWAEEQREGLTRNGAKTVATPEDQARREQINAEMAGYLEECKTMLSSKLNDFYADLKDRGFNVPEQGKYGWGPLSDGLLWQADHIKEVRDGGGAAPLDGYQTLCTPCHKKKTREGYKK